MDKLKWEFKILKKLIVYKETIQEYKFSWFMHIHFYNKQHKEL